MKEHGLTPCSNKLSYNIDSIKSPYEPIKKSTLTTAKPFNFETNKRAQLNDTVVNATEGQYEPLCL